MFRSCQNRCSRGVYIASNLLRASKARRLFLLSSPPCLKGTSRLASYAEATSLSQSSWNSPPNVYANRSGIIPGGLNKWYHASANGNEKEQSASKQAQEMHSSISETPELVNNLSEDHEEPARTLQVRDHDGTLQPEAASPDVFNDASPFQLDPSQILRLTKRVRGKNVMQERKANWNSILKSKGTWSYDWRIPLLMLKTSSLEQDSHSVFSPIQYQYYLVGNRSDYGQIPVEEIPRPIVWSKSRFVAHVDALATAKVPRVLQRFVYSKDAPSAFKSSDAHVFRVRNALHALFDDRTLQPYFSASAFDTALIFFSKNNMTRSSRKIFNIMVESRIPILPNTFNAMLWGAAKRRDLHNFTYLLRLMVHQNIRPNHDTWIAFLAAVDSEVVKLTIMRTMEELGLLKNPRVLQMAIVQLLSMEVKAHARARAPFQALIDRLNSKYGEDWISVQAGNKICEGLGQAGLTAQIPEMLSLMHTRKCLPDKVTLNIILAHCMRAQSHSLALHTIKRFRTLYGINPTETEYGYLFMLGWSTKSYNACRVIWRIACVEAAVPYRMEELVFKSLIRNTPQTPKNPNQRWMKDAGKVIVGVKSNNPSGLVPGSSALEEMTILTQWSPTGSTRTKALVQAKETLRADLASSQTLHNTFDFIDVYEQALTLDGRWKMEDGSNADDIWWKLRHAIQLNFPPRIRKVWAK